MCRHDFTYIVCVCHCTELAAVGQSPKTLKKPCALLLTDAHLAIPLAVPHSHQRFWPMLLLPQVLINDTHNPKPISNWRDMTGFQ